MRAYVMIHAIEGKTGSTASLLRRTRGVLSVHEMAGGHDILTLVDGDGVDDLDGLVAHRIGTMPGISRARTSFHLGSPAAAVAPENGEGDTER